MMMMNHPMEVIERRGAIQSLLIRLPIVQVQRAVSKTMGPVRALEQARVRALGPVQARQIPAAKAIPARLQFPLPKR